MFPIILFMIIYIICLIVDFPCGPCFFFFCLKRKLGQMTELSNMSYSINPAYDSQRASSLYQQPQQTRCPFQPDRPLRTGSDEQSPSEQTHLRRR